MYFEKPAEKYPTSHFYGKLPALFPNELSTDHPGFPIKLIQIYSREISLVTNTAASKIFISYVYYILLKILYTII